MSDTCDDCASLRLALNASEHARRKDAEHLLGERDTARRLSEAWKQNCYEFMDDARRLSDLLEAAVLDVEDGEQYTRPWHQEARHALRRLGRLRDNNRCKCGCGAYLDAPKAPSNG